MKKRMELAAAKAMNMMKKEDGMETMETVILIAVAIVVAGAIIFALTGDDHQGGVIHNLFESFQTAITNIFT